MSYIKMGFFDMLKNGFNRILDFGGTIRSGIGKAWDFVKRLPIIGNLAEGAVNTPIPFLNGASVKNIADGASTALDVANDVRKTIEPNYNSGRIRLQGQYR